MNVGTYVKRVILLSITSSCLFLSACVDRMGNEECQKEEIVTPTVAQKVEAINVYTPEHVANLTKIVIALEKYKQDRRSYPIGSMSMSDWDSLFTENGELNSFWLSELIPTYINAIPVALNHEKRNEYVYKSDGANYKLLVVNSNDCEYVKFKTPDLIDPRRGCRAYGFWTVHATNW